MEIGWNLTVNITYIVSFMRYTGCTAGGYNLINHAYQLHETILDFQGSCAVICCCMKESLRVLFFVRSSLVVKYFQGADISQLSSPGFSILFCFAFYIFMKCQFVNKLIKIAVLTTLYSIKNGFGSLISLPLLQRPWTSSSSIIVYGLKKHTRIASQSKFICNWFLLAFRYTTERMLRLMYFTWQ